jgi:Glycosyl transferase family 41
VGFDYGLWIETLITSENYNTTAVIFAFLFFQGARTEIFAMRPSPIQVSYMGFPGTTGATYIDYLVTDEVEYLIFLTLSLFLPF